MDSQKGRIRRRKDTDKEEANRQLLLHSDREDRKAGETGGAKIAPLKRGSDETTDNCRQLENVQDDRGGAGLRSSVQAPGYRLDSLRDRDCPAIHRGSVVF